MQLSGIIAISGRPGLFKVIAQSKNSVIVESMIDTLYMPMGNNRIRIPITGNIRCWFIKFLYIIIL
jgi:hypothetical protein